MLQLRPLAVAISLCLAVDAWAFRARPVSDLRFEGIGRSTFDIRLASDGEDFLAFSSRGFIDYRLFVQKIVDGNPAGPQRYLGTGRTAGLAWTGSGYLAAWDGGKAMYVARVSPEGTPLDSPVTPVVNGNTTHLAVNGSTVFAIGYTDSNLTLQPLTIAGGPSGAPLHYTAPASRAFTSVGPTPNGGFAIVFTGYQNTSAMLFRADGSLLRTMLIDGPYGGMSTSYHSTTAVVGTDGSDIVIIYGAGIYHGDAELKSVVLAADGTEKSRRVLRTASGPSASLEPWGLIWDGSQFVVALGIDRAQQLYQTNVDAALLRVLRSGEASGDLAWIAEGDEWQPPLAFASNGELHIAVAPHDLIAIDPVTLQAGAPARLGRTLSAQQELTIEPGVGGYLAAWFEADETGTTVRASRIDAAGNYLDGEGIVLGTAEAFPYFAPSGIAIDGRGPHWLVMWTASPWTVSARTISRTGEPGPAPVTIGDGYQMDAWWDGTRYIVLRSDSEGSLNRDVLAADGTVLETALLFASASGSGPFGTSWYEQYTEPTLTMAGGRLAGVFAKIRTSCHIGTPGGCFDSATIMGLPLDRPGAEPFVLDTGTWGQLDAATDGNRALVVWSRYEGVFGAFLDSPDAAGARFAIKPDNAEPELAFDGTDFLLAQGSGITRVTSGGAIAKKTALRLESGEAVERVKIAASPTLPPLLGLVHRLPAYDNISRGAVLFERELETQPSVPQAPVVTCSTVNADGTITVRWQPVSSALGISIELQLADGTFRPIDVAAANATTARVSTAGLSGTAVRVRAWNESGLSAPSPLAPAGTPPAATLREALRTCAGTAATLSYSLSGIAPFTVRWSDGLVQTNLGATASRTVTASRDVTLRILSITDQSCAANQTPKAVRILVDPLPAITDQPHEVKMPRGQQATLTIEATDSTKFEWFEGNPGNTSKPVGTNSASFTTPELQQTTRYWVRLSNRCGSVQSAAIVVTTSGGKGRAVRK